MDTEDNNQDNEVLDLSKRCLKKIPKTENSQLVKVLILDDNELQKIDNIDSYLRIEKLSLCKNQLLRMYGVARLHNLRELDLSYNGILTIEALKECSQLTHLNLERNNIKSIEHLNTNVKLEYLNLSENSIGIISDISFLKCLKELYLHGNRISHLRQCDRYLPTSLEVLTLAKNNVTDLNEICTLSNLSNLNSITIADNPCVQMTGGSSVGFDYRPFLLNWCMSVKQIDGYVVNPIESLKAEWLYSQGKGRSFRVGEQQALAIYLSQACPLSGEALENENERKLRLILSKAQQHQRQLQEQGSNPTTPNNSSSNNSPSSLRRKGPSRIQSPRITRLSGRPNSAETMSSSYHGNISSSMIQSTIETNHSNLLEMTKSLCENFTSDNLMTQSLDPTILSYNTGNNGVREQSSPVNNGSLYNEQSTVPIVQSMGPLAAASKMMPVPESLMSPDCAPVPIIQQRAIGVSGLTTSTTNYTVTQSTVKTIRNKDNRASSKSPRPGKRPEQQKSSSPQPQSPRKTITNVSNAKIQHHSIMKQHIQHVTPPETASSVISSEDEDEDDDSDKINVEKLKSIRKTAQKCQKQKENQHQIQQQVQQKQDSLKQISNKDTENSVILIQKLWRGYSTRKKTKSIADVLLKKRTQDYIVKLSKDMEMTKQALENERKIQQLQMQAINALWKKVSTMQPDGSVVGVGQTVSGENIGISGDSSNIVQDLTKTCTVLTNQVQQLQLSMRDILNCMTLFASLPQNAIQQQLNSLKDTCETQTEIIAVHTPQIENPHHFPFVGNKQIQRPSTLPITSSSNDSSASTKSSHNNTANTNTDDFDHKLVGIGEVEIGEEPSIAASVENEGK